MQRPRFTKRIISPRLTKPGGSLVHIKHSLLWNDDHIAAHAVHSPIFCKKHGKHEIYVRSTIFHAVWCSIVSPSVCVVYPSRNSIHRGKCKSNCSAVVLQPRQRQIIQLDSELDEWRCTFMNMIMWIMWCGVSNLA